MVIMIIARFKLFDIILSQTHINFQNILPSDMHFKHSNKKKYPIINNKAIESHFTTSKSPLCKMTPELSLEACSSLLEI